MSTGNQKTKFNKKNNKKPCSSFIKFLCLGISFRLCVSFGWNTRINGLDVYYYSLHRYKLLQRQKRSSNSSLPDVIVQMSLYIQSLCTFSFPPSCDLMSRDFHFVFRFFLSFEKELKSSRFYIFFKTGINRSPRKIKNEQKIIDESFFIRRWFVF